MFIGYVVGLVSLCVKFITSFYRRSIDCSFANVEIPSKTSISFTDT